MHIDATKLFTQHNIPFAVEGQRWGRRGWVQICCPFCIDKKYHMGYSTTKGVFNCYKCGIHPTVETIATLLRIPKAQAFKIASAFRGDQSKVVQAPIAATERPQKCVWPAGTLNGLLKVHERYLAGRGFDVQNLVDFWGIVATGALGRWMWRVMIPVMAMDGTTMVAYQGRDITGKQKLRYKSSEDSDSVRPIKSCLYGLDQVAGNDIIIVEGVPSVWKMGAGVVATFGTAGTDDQLLLMTKFERRFFLFDDEDEAQERATKMATALSSLDGKHTEVIRMSEVKDPGDLTYAQARALKNEILKSSG